MTDTPTINTLDDPPWELPLPLGWSASLPPFPVDALPKTLRDYVAAISAQIQTPPDLAGTVVLGMLAAAVGGRVRVRARGGWIEPSNLYTVAVARPASRKSAVIDVCRRPLTVAQERLRVAYGDEVADSQTRKEILTRYAENMKVKAAKTADVADIAEAQSAVREAEQAKEMNAPRLWTSDATPERLETLMAEQGGRIAGISAEAGIFESFGGRYSKTANIELLLEAHAGDSRASDRQTRRGTSIAAPALTIIASVQPFAMNAMVARPDYGGRGLLQRVLWALVPDNVGRREWEAPEAPEAVVAAYNTLVADLAVAMYGFAEAVTLPLDEPASKRLGDYYRQVEKLMAADGEHGDGLIQEWAGKLVGATVRIAGILHATQNPPQLDAAERPVPWSAGRITEATMESAIRIAEYYRTHAATALAEANTKATQEYREFLCGLAETMAEKKISGAVKIRDLQRIMPRRFRSRPASELKSLLERTAALGWTRPAPDGGWFVYPDTATLLATPLGGDSGDNGDNGEEPAGQGHPEAHQPPVTAAGDSGDKSESTSGVVTAVTTTGDSPGRVVATAVTSNDAESVTVVTAVTTSGTVKCLRCGRSLDKALAPKWHGLRVHPSCSTATARRAS